jgi:hypothetical protein
MPDKDDKRNFNRLDLIMGFEGTHSGGIPKQSFWSITQDNDGNWNLVNNISMRPEEIRLVLDQIMNRIEEARNKLQPNAPMPTAILVHSYDTFVPVKAHPNHVLNLVIDEADYMRGVRSRLIDIEFPEELIETLPNQVQLANQGASSTACPMYALKVKPLVAPGSIIELKIHFAHQYMSTGAIEHKVCTVKIMITEYFTPLP